MAVNKTKLKKQIFDIIQIGDKSNLASRAFDIFIVGVILSSIFSAYGRRISCIPHAPEERL